MTLPTLLQIFMSGLMMGLIYALVSVGLALIFGLMDVVNFAHGDFLMFAMYATFGLVVFTGLDPIVVAPVVAGFMFVFGAVVYFLIIRYALRARTNRGMVQIFATFGLGIFMQGVAQYLFSPDYRSIKHSWLGAHTLHFSGLYLPLPQIFGSVLSLLTFAVLYFLVKRTDFGRALEATREDQGAVALVGIDRNRMFALGWGVGAALVGIAGSVLAIFYYIYPQVGAPFALIAYVTVALGGFGSIFGALAAGVIVGLVEAFSGVLLPPELKSLGLYVLYLGVVFVRPSGLFGKF